jgi:hypothetical protein
MENLKLPPYQRLKNILTEGDPLSKKGLDNLDELLGEKKESSVSFLTKIVDFFKKIDSKIFTKPSRTNNNMPHRRIR